MQRFAHAFAFTLMLAAPAAALAQAQPAIPAVVVLPTPSPSPTPLTLAAAELQPAPADRPHNGSPWSALLLLPLAFVHAGGSIAIGVGRAAGAPPERLHIIRLTFPLNTPCPPERRP